MSKRPNVPLPDLSDDEILKQRLQPLADKILPQKQERALEPIRPAKPKRQKVEFLLPEPVVLEIKTRAARRQISGTTLLLEVLRDAGYPVTEADFVDLRKLPRRAG